MAPLGVGRTVPGDSIEGDDTLMKVIFVAEVFLIVSEGLSKSSPNVTIFFFAKFQSQFDSLYLSRS